MTGNTTTLHNEGDGWHNNGKGQQDDMRHDNGNRRQHGDGKGQQGDRRYNDVDGQQDEAARRGTTKAMRGELLQLAFLF